uniref:HMG box domain-containing protein n=1 Tax=Haemonchus placei TaxID=6290 RepID=A0A0N4X6T8_HAEPC
LKYEVGTDSNKLVSAYAMFFKERQTYVKKSFPHATFGDISRIVAAQWDALEKHEKIVSHLLVMTNIRG